MTGSESNQHSTASTLRWLIPILAFAGGLLVWYAMRWGPWGYRDSAAFLELARNLIRGRGLFTIQASGELNPWVKQPPLYPILLAVFGRLGMDLLIAGRWINVFSIMGLVSLLGWGLWKLRIPSLSILLVLLILVPSPVIVEHYTSLLTEPLYLTTAVGALLFLAIYLQQGGVRYAAISSVFLIACTLTRYAGMAILAGASLTFLLFHRTISFRRRIRDVSLYTVLNGLPLALWMLFQFGSSAFGATAPSFPTGVWEALRPLRANLVDLTWVWMPLTRWLPQTTYRVRGFILSVLLILLVGLFSSLVRRSIRNQQRVNEVSSLFVAAAFMLTALVHILFLIAVTIIGPWEVRIDIRQLSPIYLFGPIGTLLLLFHALQSLDHRMLRYTGMTVLSLAFLVSFLPRSWDFVQTMRSEGLGYTSAYWHNATILSVVDELPDDIVIISNEPEALYFHLERRAYRLPDLQSGQPAPITETFGDDLDNRLHMLFRQNKAVLVLVSAANNRLLPLYGEQLEERLVSMVNGLDVQYERWDGAIYWYSPDHP